MSIALSRRTLLIVGIAQFATTGPLIGEESPSVYPSRIIQFGEESEGEPAVVSAVAVSPDGKWLAAAGDDHLIRIWDMATGRFLRRLEGHGDWVRTVAFSPDSLLLISAGNDRTVRFWDPSSARLVRTVSSARRAICSLVVHPDGKTIAAVGF
ncbi:MAG: WD40 repeat domain-containing protein, partial [Pirellulaceae bacterium]